MDRLKAKSILAVLDKINNEIDLVGKILINNQLKPVPARVRAQSPLKFK